MTHPDLDDEILMAYADGEADEQTVQLVEAAMQADGAIRERVAMFMESTNLLRAAFADMRPPVMPPVLHQARRRATWSARGWRALRLAVPVAAAIAGFVVNGERFSVLSGWGVDPGVAEISGKVREVAEYHSVFVNETEHLVEVPASRQSHIEAWLGARVGFDLAAPDLSARGLTFVGARMLVVDAHPVAQLMYTDARGVPVALCVTAMEHGASADMHHIAQRGFDLYAQAKAGHLFILVTREGSEYGRDLSEALPVLLRRG